MKLVRRFHGVQRTFFIAVMLLAFPLFGGTKQWTNNGGTGDGLWTTASNWFPAGVPGSTDDVQIGTDQTAGNVTLSATNVTVNSLTITDPYLATPVLEVKNAANLTINGASSIGSGATLFLNNANITGPGALTISGTLNWSAGTIDGTGALIVNSGANVNITGATYYTYLVRNTTNAGTITMGALPYHFYLYNGPTLTNTGIIDITADKDLWSAGSGTATIVNNSGGTIKKSGGTGVAYIRTSLTNNSGATVSAQSGTLAISAGGSGSGDFATVGGASPSTLSFDGTVYTINSGATFSGLGTFAVTNRIIVGTGATITVSNLQLGTSNSRIDGAGTVTITGSFVFNAGSMYGPGTTVLESGATATIGAGYYKYLDSARTFTIKGSVNYSDGTHGLYIYNGSTLAIDASGTFDITSTGIIGASGSGNSVVNAGTFSKTGGTNQSLVQPTFTSSGTVSVTSGNLALQNTATFNGGTVTIGTTSALQVTAGTTTIAAATTFGGTGTVQISGGKLRVPTGVSVTIPKLVLDNGSSAIGGSGTLTTPNFTFTGGSLGLSTDTGGNVVLSGPATFGNAYYKYFDHAITVTNNSTISYNAPNYALYLYNGATLVNNGTFDIQSDGSIWSGGSPAPSITNNSTVTKSAGTGASTINVAFNNASAATLNVASGRIELTGGGANSGAFTSSASATIRVGSTYTLNSTTNFSGHNGTFEITGVAVVPSGSLTIPNLLLSNGYLAGAGTVTLTGTATWGGGSMGHSSYPGGTTVVDTGATLNLSGTVGHMSCSDSRTLTNNGTINYTSTNGQLYLYNTTFNNAALFDIKTDLEVNTSGTTTVANTGTIQKTSGTATTDFSPRTNNGGTISVTAGTLSMNGGGSHVSGTFTAGSSGTLAFNGGTHTLDAASSIGGSGAVSFISSTVTANGSYSAAVTTITNGTFTLNGTGSTGSYSQSGGTLGGSGTLTINGSSTWSGGSMNGSGQTIIPAGQTMTIPDTSYKYLDTRTLTNNGTINYTGTATSYYLQIYNNGTLNNAGTLDLQNDFQIYGYGNGTINNTGLIKKSAGTGSTTITAVVNNNNSISVTTGTIILNGGGTHTNGSISITSPGTLAFANGTHTVSGTGNISGTGTLAFHAGASTIGIPVTVGAIAFSNGTGTFNAATSTDTLTISNGTLGGTGTVTVNQGGTWTAGTMNGTGTTVLVTGKSMTFADGGYKYLDTRTFTNNGTIHYNGSVGYYLQIYNNGTLNNAGTLQLAGDNQIYGYNGGTINNSGTISKTSGTGTTAIAAAVNNSGTVSTTTGTISLNGGGTHTNGTFSATSPATIAFGNGTHAVSGSGALTGTGTIAFTGATATVSSGYNPGTISITGGTVAFDSNGTTGTLTLTNGTLSGAGILTATDGGTWSGGTMSGSGSTVIPAGKTFAITDYTYKGLTARTLQNQGTVTYSPVNYHLQVYNSGVIQNSGTFDIKTDQQIYGYGGGTFNNSGTLTKSAGSGTTNVAPIVNNSGTVSASVGTLSLDAGGTHTNGSFVASGTGTVGFGGGTHTISGTGSLSGIGTFAFTGSTTTTIGVPYNVGGVRISSGNAIFNTNGTAGTLTMTVNGGTLGGSGTFTVTGAANWAAGTMSGTGSTVISAGQTLDLAGSGYKYLDTRTLVNNGTMIYPGTGSYHLQVYNNGTINNTGTLTLATDIVLYGYSGGTINNSGSINKSAGTGVLEVYPVVNNTGTLTVSSGTLRLRGGGTHTGLFVADTGTVLEFIAGTHSTSAASSLTGAGTYRVSGGTVTVDGSYTSPIDITNGTLTLNSNGSIATFSQIGGTLNGTGTLTITGSAIWGGGTMSGTGQTVFGTGSTVSMPGTNYATLSGRTVTNKGSLTYNPAAYYLGIDGATFVNEGTFDLKNDTIIYAYGVSPTINNNGGTFQKTGGTSTQQYYGAFQNSGSVLLNSGTFIVSGGYTQSAGLTQVQNATLQTATVNIAGGTLAGTGTISGSVVNDAIVAPGTSAGSLTVTGNYTQSATGDLNIELGGTTAGTQYDRLVVNGTATLGGDLNISTINSFTPAAGNTFQVLTFASRANGSDFAAKNGLSVGGGATLVAAYSSTDLQLTADVVQADLALTASPVSGTIYSGQSFTYTLSVANGGGSNASGVTVTATLPSNVSFVSASPAVCAGSPLSCSIGNIANGASASLAINVVATASGNAQLNASVTSSQYDPSTANNSASTAATINAAANLGVTITDAPDPVEAGTNIVYTTVVTNHGPDSASGVSLAAAPGANLTFVSNSGGCTSAFPCSLGTLSSGQSVTITSTYSVAPTASANVSTTMTVSSASPADLTSSNNTATASSSVAQDADVSVTKTGPATVSPDAASSVSYTITVTNHGPSAATGVTVADPPVAGLTFVSASGACSSFPCTIGSLTVGQTATTTATYSISGGIGTTVTNTASVTATTPDGDTSDNSSSVSTTIGNCTATSITAPQSVFASSTNNNASATFLNGATYSWTITNGTITGGQGSSSVVFTAGASGSVTLTVAITAGSCSSNPSVTIPIGSLADVAISKTGPSSVTSSASATVTYTITASNNGPSPAAGVTVTDPTPNGLAFVSATGACTSFPCSLGTLAAGATATTQVTYSVSAATGTTVTNTATISTTTPESSSANNQSSVSTTVSSCPATSISAPQSVYGGTSGNTATATNVNGAAYSWNITNGTITSGQNGRTVTFTAGTSGNVTLSVSISSGACNSTPNVTVPIVVEADVAVAKSGPSTVSAESQSTVTYSIVVTNNGPSPAEGIALEDPTPSGLAFVSASGACSAFPCSIGGLNAGQSLTVSATYDVTDAVGTTVTNTATVSASTPDSSSFNDSASVSTSISACPSPVVTAPSSVVANTGGHTATVTTVSGATYNWTVSNGTLTAGQGTTSITFTAGASGNVAIAVTVTVGGCTSTPSASVAIASDADLSVTKTGPASTTSNTVTYTIVVKNNGPATATGVSLADPAPANTTFVSATGACSSFPCTIGSLAAGQSVTTEATFNVSAAAETTVTNVATVSATSPDSNSANNSASAATGVSSCPSTAISAPQVVYAGTTNNAASVTSVANATYNWTISNGTITSGAGTSSILFTAGATGSVTLTVTVTSGACTSSPSVTIPIAVHADLSVVKSGPGSTVASTATYTLVVTNHGPSDATGVALSDPTPAGFTFVSASGACTTLPCALGTMTAGQSATTQVTFNTSGATGTTVTNTATVTATTSDSNTSNNTSSVTTSIGTCAAPAITAPATVCPLSTNNSASVVPQQNATYLWSITNGTITTGQGTSSITFDAGSSGTVMLGVSVTTNCTSSANASVSIAPPTNATITAPASVCTLSTGNASVPQQQGATYAWTITNGTLASGEGTNAITFTAGSTGTVTLGVTVTTAAGCTASSSHNVTIAANGVATITAPTTVCPLATSTASVPSQQGATYAWTITNGTISGGQGTSAVTFSAGSSGSVGLSVTVTSNSCSSSGSTSVAIESPAVTITGPTSTCPNAAVTLDAGAGFATYAWSTGETTRTITVTPATTATYSVTVTTANGCSATDAHSVEVAPNAVATITAPAAVCPLSTNSASVPAQQGASYSWTITNGTIDGGQGTNAITFSASGSGSVAMSVNVTSNSCSASGAVTIAIETPSVTITGPGSTCPNAAVTLDAGAGFATYSWSTGETTRTITVSPSQSSSYSVTVTTANGCTATDSHAVTVEANPIAAVVAPSTVCAGGEATATVAAQQGASYVWTITNGTITAGQGTNAVTFTAGATGSVGVSVGVTSGSCNSTGSATVSIAAPPAVSIDGPATACPNQPFTLDAGAGFASYLWSNGARTRTISLAQSQASMVYTVTVKNAAGCSANASHTVTLASQPAATITAPATVPANSTGHTASVTPIDGATYNWTITNGALTSDPAASSVTFNAGASGAVGLSVTVTAGGCSTLATHTVTIGASSGCPTAAPQLVAPAHGAQNVASPVTFAWSGVAGASEYEVWITSGGLNTLAGTTTALSLTAPVPSGNATWYVVARLGNGCEPLTSAQRTFTVASSDTCSQNGRPQLTAPVAGAIASSPVTFQWTAVPGATGYRVWIEANGTAAQDVGTTNGATTLSSVVPSGSIAAYVDALFSGCPATRSDRILFSIPAPDPCAARSSATPLSPVNGSTLASSAVEFRWTAVAGAAGYRVWASRDGGTAAVLGNTTSETSLRAAIAPGTVSWWIESLFEGCASTDSQRFTFTVPAGQNCGDARAELIAPANGSTTSNGNVTFSWTGVPNAVAYELWLSLGSGTPTLVATTTATSVIHVVPAGKLEWFVRATLDRCPSRDSRSSRFTFEPPAACATTQRPIAIEPLDKSTLTSPLSFSWSATPGATRYELFAAHGNSEPAAIASTTDTTVRNVTLANGNHRWFVRAHLGDGCAPLDSTEQKLVVVPAPNACSPLAAPIISAPGQVSSGIELRIQWSPVAGATSYQLQLASTGAFADAETITTNATQHSITRTNHGGDPLAVHARVRAVDARCSVASASAFGRPSAFYILPVQGTEAGAPLTATGVATFEVPLGAEYAGQTFSISVQEPWLSVTPSSGVVPAGGMTLTATADLGQLGAGANLASIRVTFSASNAKMRTNATTVTLPTVSVSKTTPVIPSPKTTPPPDALIIPAVAHADGINSKFQSDVRVTNTSPQLMQYQVTFTPSGGAGIANGRQTTFSIDPGRTVALDDVLRSWFGTGGESVTGTLEVRPMTQTAATIPGAALLGGLPELLTFASSRTFNVTPNGTFGQYIPAIPFANFIGRVSELDQASSVLSLQQIAQSDRYRTNLGIVEGSGEPAELLVKVFGDNGQKLTEFPVSLAGGQHTQLNGFLRDYGIQSLNDGRVEISVTSPTGKVTAYASVLDNATSDPLLVNPVTLTDTGANKWVVPGVADLNNGIANWQTDMRIFNAGTEEVTATLSYYSQNGGAAKSSSVTIPPGQVRQFDKTLSSIFGVSNDGGAVHIATSSAARLIATARTYNQTSNGTYGQFISAVTPGESAALGTRPLQILQVEESVRFRSNIGLAEVSGNPVTLEISIVPPNTKFTAVTEVHLAANEFRQLPSVLRAIGFNDTFNARVTVRVIAGTGRVTAYASVIDQLTNDPTYVPAQ